MIHSLSQTPGADLSDSDADVSTGKTGIYTLSSGEFNQTSTLASSQLICRLPKTVSDTTPTVGSNVTYTTDRKQCERF